MSFARTDGGETNDLSKVEDAWSLQYLSARTGESALLFCRVNRPRDRFLLWEGKVIGEGKVI
jgi:hypothetical protein